MATNRTKSWLLAWGLHLLLISTAAAQTDETEFVHGLGDAKLFSPADLSSYGNGPRRPKGFFVSIEGLQWTINRPERTTVGREGFSPVRFDGQGFIRQPNSVDTGFLSAEPQSGERVEFGFVEDQRGWFFSGFKLKTQSQELRTSNAGVSFIAPTINGISVLEGFVDLVGPRDPMTGAPGPPDGVDDDLNGNHIFGRDGEDLGTPNNNPPPAFIPPFDEIPDVPAPTDFGDLVSFPVFFDKLNVRNRTKIYSVEMNRLWQFDQNRRGGRWEIFAGTRYMRFRENFDVTGLGRVVNPNNNGGGGGNNQPTMIVGILADSKWNTAADNNLIGPQIGLRGSRRWGRLSLNAESRFAALANFQSVRQIGTIADKARRQSELNSNNNGGNTMMNTTRILNAPLNLFATSFTHAFHATEFSPLVEMRFDLSYQVWRNINLNAGWTGMYMNGIARPSNMINYTLLDMGILGGRNQQNVFIQGLNFGVEINR